MATIYQGVLVKGHYNFSWDGKNNSGMTLGSGAYFTVVKMDKKIEIQKDRKRRKKKRKKKRKKRRRISEIANCVAICCKCARTLGI